MRTKLSGVTFFEAYSTSCTCSAHLQGPFSRQWLIAVLLIDKQAGCTNKGRLPTRQEGRKAGRGKQGGRKEGMKTGRKASMKAGINLPTSSTELKSFRLSSVLPTREIDIMIACAHAKSLRPVIQFRNHVRLTPQIACG